MRSPLGYRFFSFLACRPLYLSKIKSMMYQDFDLREFFKKHKKRILTSIFLFWFLFALFIIIENEISLHLNGIKVDPVDRLQYCIRWVLWFFLTPLVIKLAIRFPITRKNLLYRYIQTFLICSGSHIPRICYRNPNYQVCNFEPNR